MLEHVVGYGHEGVFLAEHGAVLTDHGETVDIGVDDEGYVVVSLAHEVAYVREVFLERFGVVGEVAGGLEVEARHLCYAELAEQFGQDDAAHGVHRVDGHAEVGLADGLHIDEFEELHHLDVALVEVEVLGVAAEVVYIGEGEVLLVGDAHYFGGFFGRKELTLLVEELQGVPLARIVTGGDDDAAHGALHRHGELGGRRRGKADVEYIEAHAHEGAAHYVRYHFARYAGVAAHYDFAAVGADMFFSETGVGRNRLGDVDGAERVARFAADSTAEAGDGFDQCHSIESFYNGL